jgi:hypothetical protein
MPSLPANIRVNAAFPFPAQVAGSGPISIGRQSGIWTVGYDVSRFVPTTPPSSALATDYTLVWDSVAKTFINVPLAALIGSILPDSGVIPGAYTNTNLTVDSKGRITVATNGTGAGTAVQYDTAHGANSLASAHVPPSANIVQTGGYAAVGDGGGALYQRMPGAPTYPTYAIQDAGGTYWQYIPEAAGWNAKVAGVVADGSADDSPNLMNALLPFQSSEIIAGGGNRTGTLLLPAATMLLRGPIYITGGNSPALGILGQSQSATGGSGPSMTAFQWGGVGTYPSMVILYGANQFIIEGVNFNGTTGSNLVNDVHITADNHLQTPGFAQLHLAGGPYPAGVNTFVCDNVISGGGTAGLQVGASVGIGLGSSISGVSNFEIVYVTALVGTNGFTATSTQSHSSGENVGNSPPTNNITFSRCAFSVPPPFVDNKSCAVLVGNQIQSTVQAAQIILDSCISVGGEYRNSVTISVGSPAVITDIGYKMLANTPIQFDQGDTLPSGLFHGFNYYVLPINANTYNVSLTPGGAPIATTLAGSGTHVRKAQSYTGLRAIVGGNIKNYNINNSIFNHCQYGLAGESFSGSVQITYPTFAGNFVADILANGATNIDVFSAETESAGQRFLSGTGGAGAQSATVKQVSYQSGLPSDGYVIDWFGNLIMEGCSWFNQAPTGSPIAGACPGVRNGAVSNSAFATTLAPSATISIGCYWQFGGPDVAVFYDGSNSPMDFGPSALNEWRLVQLNDYGDHGPFRQKMGDLGIIAASLDKFTISPGVIIGNHGQIGEFVQAYTIPYTAFTSSSTAQTLSLGRLPPHVVVTGVIMDVTVPFTALGGTTFLRCGSANVGGGVDSFINLFDASTAAVTKGLVDADFGPSLKFGNAPAAGSPILTGGTTNRQSALGYATLAAGGWTGGGEGINVQIVASGPVNTLGAGSVRVIFSYLKYR